VVDQPAQVPVQGAVVQRLDCRPDAAVQFLPLNR
jgi:hypothetical protein